LRDSSSYEVLELKLPKHLAQWLEEFAESLAMTPSQLIANILAYYYEAWRKGLEKAYSSYPMEREVESPIVDPEKLVEEFIKEIKEKGKMPPKLFIVKRFASWIRENKLDLYRVDEETIETFLREYGKTRSLKKTTFYKYKRILRRFVEFAASHANPSKHENH